MNSKMKGASLIKKKYCLNNLQILSRYELQSKLESILQSIKSNEILSDLNFFKDISQYFDSSNPEKAFLTYKFSLYCSILTSNKEQKFFQKLFLKYAKIFIKACHKYNSFIIIKIYINNIFADSSIRLSVNEFNKVINNLIEEYKNSPYNSILDININNFIKNESNIPYFFVLLDCFQFAFDKEQIQAISKYITENSNIIMKYIIKDKASKISFFKKLNNIIQCHIKDISEIIINNNSKKKCYIYMIEFFKSIITVYNEIIKFFQLGLYSFYENDFILGYIQKNLIVTIMQFLEKKNFSINEEIIVKISDLSDNLENFLLNRLKINEKKYFIEYSWTLAQIFSFLYQSEDKTSSIIYGNKIINLYKNKQFVSKAIIFVKITLYEYYLETQNDNYSEYDINEHLNNISELLTMFGKCEIEEKTTEKYLIKMLNHLLKLLLEHIIFIIDKRPTQIKEIYKLLIMINPFLINCRDNSKNKNIIKVVKLYDIFCVLTSIIRPIDNENICRNQKTNIYYFVKNNDLSESEKTIFINIISVFIVYDKMSHQKIIELLKKLIKEKNNKYFLEIYFNIFSQLERIKDYNVKLMFDLLNLLNDYFDEELKEKNKNNINTMNFKKNYNHVYIIYISNGIINSYEAMLKMNKENKKSSDNILDSNGILIEISDSIKLLLQFMGIHNKILEKLYKLVDNNNYYDKSIYYLGLNIINYFFLDLIHHPNQYFSKNPSFIYEQIYLISTNNIFYSLPKHIQNFIYYILYRLIHNINNIINNRDLFLIKGNNNISKTIKTIIYNNILLIKDEIKKSNNIKDSFFNFEPLLSSSLFNFKLENNDIKDAKIIYNNLVNKLIFNEKENSINHYANFKINFIIDTNNLIEIIKIYYLSGILIDNTYMTNYFNYYILLLEKEKEFNINFKLILNIFYLFKRIFSIPKIENQSEKIDFNFLCNFINNQEKDATKKNVIIRLLIKYIYITKGQIDSKNKINDLLKCLLSELEKLKKDQNVIYNEQKNKSYMTYIELLSLEFFIENYNGVLLDDNIDELIYKGKILLIKCIEVCNAFLNEKSIIQYIQNERYRLKLINDFFSETIDGFDMLYLLNMDDYEFVFLQLLDKIYILADFLFSKMLAYGYGDSILEIFHKFRKLTILKYNKHYFSKFIAYLIKTVRKWKRKEKYDISIDICDIKCDDEYNTFLSKLYYNYIKEKYPMNISDKNQNNNYANFNIIDFVKNNKIIDDPLLNKCLELNNIKETFNNKEKSIFFKNQIKCLNNSINKENLPELKNVFLKEFNILSPSNYLFEKFFIIDYKYIIKIIPRLFENEILNDIIFNDKYIEVIIYLFKKAYQSYKIDNWKEYKFFKYCKKNLKNLIYISSSSQMNNTTIKLINTYISYFHNFKYNLSYKGNIKADESIIREQKENDSIDYIDALNNMNANISDSDNNSDKDLKIENISDNENDEEINMKDNKINEINNNSNIDSIDNKFNSINLLTIFKIRNYFYIFVKIKDKSFFDKINIQEEKEFKSFCVNMREISVQENSKKKYKKKDKNEEYRKALFTLQNLLIKLCPNFVKGLQLYYYFHTNFNNYINSKIGKYSLKIKSNELINWLFEQNNDKIRTKNTGHYKINSKRFKLMSIGDYKNKFINKIFNSDKFKFSFYENNPNELIYYIPSIELSSLPLENIPLLYNLPIIRTLNINYIKLSQIQKDISITKDIFCLLNPKSDLKDTEKKILPIILKNNIKCIYSKEPTEKEMANILNDKLMYIYCGHGDSLKYLKKEYIESHQINFLTFLFGCNSAHSRLLSEKDTQPLSTPQLFLKKLCPFFFGFLWTVTSSDIDEFTVELLDRAFNNKNPVSLLKIIILLKRKLKLKWYNGGALVMYSNCDILLKFRK